MLAVKICSPQYKAFIQTNSHLAPMAQAFASTLGAQDADDLVTGDHLHLGDAVGVAAQNS